MNNYPNIGAHWQGNRGFTLVEVIIAMVIIAILASIAIPQYGSYVRKSNRAVAKAHLQTLVGTQEAYALQHRSQYATTLEPIVGLATPYYIGNDGQPTAALQAESLYKITLKGATISGYELVAESVGRQATDECNSFHITPDGRRWANADTWAAAKLAEDTGCWK